MLAKITFHVIPEQYVDGMGKVVAQGQGIHYTTRFTDQTIGVVHRILDEIWAKACVSFSTSFMKHRMPVQKGTGTIVENRFDLQATFDSLAHINVYLVPTLGRKVAGYCVTMRKRGVYIAMSEQGGHKVQISLLRFANTLAHEIGHAFGLPHRQGELSLMNEKALNAADTMIAGEMTPEEIARVKANYSLPMPGMRMFTPIPMKPVVRPPVSNNTPCFHKKYQADAWCKARKNMRLGETWVECPKATEGDPNYPYSFGKYLHDKTWRGVCVPAQDPLPPPLQPGYQDGAQTRRLVVDSDDSWDVVNVIV